MDFPYAYSTSMLIFSFTWLMLHKRPVDFFTVSIASSIAYGIGGIFGVVPDYPSYSKTYSVPQSFYVLYGNLILLLMIGAKVSDYLVKAKPQLVIIESKRSRQLFIYFAIIISLLALLEFMLLIASGASLLQGAEKREIAESRGFLYNAVMYTLLIIAIHASFFRYKAVLLTVLCLLCMDLIFTGMRAHLIFVTFLIGYVYFSKFRKYRFASQLKLMALGLSLSFIFLTFKVWIRPLLDGSIEPILNLILEDGLFFYYFSRGEPFTQAAIFSAVEQNIHAIDVPASYSLIDGFLPAFAQNNVVRLHDITVQVFPELDPGVLGNSIWAEALINLGQSAIFVAPVLYAGIIFLLNYAVKKSNKIAVKKLIIACFVVPVCFYIHRNDLYYTVTLIRRFALAYVFLTLSIGLVLYIDNRRIAGFKRANR